MSAAVSSDKINLRHFFALADIADAGRLSAAAERVSLSQPALTQALRKLEHAAGTPLFDRVGFGVSETTAGKMLVQRARRAKQLLDDAGREINARSGAKTASSPLHRHASAAQLRALVAVVETGGYSAAARQLGLAQPTVHRSLSDLGAATSIELFRRTARGIEATDAATSLARFAELVFAEMRQGFEEIRELRGSTDSRVAIGSLPLVRSEFLPTAVTMLLSKYPDARVSILDGPYAEQLRAVRHGRIDWLIGALRDPLPTADIVQEPLFEQPLAIVVRPGHPLLGRPSPPVEALAELDWVAPRAPIPARTFFNEFFERNGIAPPTRIIECSSLIATRGILLQSDRAAVLSPLQIREDVAAGELAVLVDEVPKSYRSIGVTTRKNWHPTLVQAEFGRLLHVLAQPLRKDDPRT